jgi:hypothetical protein
MSLPQLANEIGMSKAGIYLAIKEKRLTVENLEKIADSLNVSITEFFDVSRIDQLNQMQKELNLIKDINELERHLSVIEEKLQTRQTIINLVLYQLKTIISRRKNLLLSDGELAELGYKNVEQFISETIENLDSIIDTVKVNNIYVSDIPDRPARVVFKIDEASDNNTNPVNTDDSTIGASTEMQHDKPAE